MNAQAPFLFVLKDASNLAHRLQESAVLRTYLLRRLGLLIPAGLLMLVASIASAAGTVFFIGGTRPVLVLAAMLLAPFVLVGSFFVQSYVFLSWLEGRALARTYGRAGPGLPRIPWLLAAVLFLAPLAMLVLAAPKPGLALVALLVAMPVAYARLEG